jgi:hypothetical protein
MRGFITSMLLFVGIAAVMIIISLVMAFFSGGIRSTGLFGWSDIPYLAGVETFITSIYNTLVYFASWVAVLVLLTVFILMQCVFGYIYYRVAKFLLGFRAGIEKVLDELLSI